MQKQLKSKEDINSKSRKIYKNKWRAVQEK